MQTLSKTGRNRDCMISLNKTYFKIPAIVFHGIIVVSQSVHRHTNRQHYRPLFVVVSFLLAFFISPAQEITIQFHHIANGKPLILSDSNYTNAFGEHYQVSRLKYYISNAGFAENNENNENNISLVDAAENDSIIVHAKPGIYSALYFTLGVDSALNCSGAQDGALDPLNGMFWTWNSGYIFFKLEGYSSSSTADLQRIEHHVGGYRYPNKVSHNIKLALSKQLEVKKGGKLTVHITLDLDKYWKGVNNIKIAEQALLMAPGGLAIKAADNFTGMFSITTAQ